jgi:hypothetical protein
VLRARELEGDGDATVTVDVAELLAVEGGGGEALGEAPRVLVDGRDDGLPRAVDVAAFAVVVGDERAAVAEVADVAVVRRRDDHLASLVDEAVGEEERARAGASVDAELRKAL